MLVFGQDAIRVHPWLLKEMEAATDDDAEGFDRALFGHIGFFISNLVRAPLLGLSGGLLSRAPRGGETAAMYRRINRLSAAFTLLADTCLLILGGKFKFREMLSGRLADALAHLYLASASLRRFEDDGRPEEDLPLLRWAVADSLHQTEEALVGVLHIFPIPALGGPLRLLLFPWGRRHHAAGDRTISQMAALLLDDTASRQRLIAGAYQSTGDDGTGLLARAFSAVLAAAPAEMAVRNALKTVPSPANVEQVSQKAVAAGVITEQQGPSSSRPSSWSPGSSPLTNSPRRKWAAHRPFSLPQKSGLRIFFLDQSQQKSGISHA